MARFDVIVVGLGGIGSAAAFHLAARGARVLGLDRFPIAHDRGSSHGQTRLIRRAYFEHPHYVPLLDRAYALWRELEARTGRRLLVESGLMLAGPPESEVLAGAIHAADKHRIPIDRLSAAEACRRWPQFTLPEDWVAVYEPQAGYLFVEACVAAHAAAAEVAGATGGVALDPNDPPLTNWTTTYRAGPDDVGRYGLVQVDDSAFGLAGTDLSANALTAVKAAAASSDGQVWPLANGALAWNVWPSDPSSPGIQFSDVAGSSTLIVEVE